MNEYIGLEFKKGSLKIRGVVFSGSLRNRRKEPTGGQKAQQQVLEELPGTARLQEPAAPTLDPFRPAASCAVGILVCIHVDFLQSFKRVVCPNASSLSSSRR